MIFLSTSGALGRAIQLPVPLIIVFRSILGLFFLLLYCKLKGFSLKAAKKDVLPIVASGIFLGLHWLTYFYALKLSNVAIGLLSLFTYPVITAFLEPIILKSKFQKVHILLGFLVLIGIYFLLPSFNFNNSYTLGVCVGILSALLYALRNIILKKQIANYNGSTLMCFQLFIVVVLLSPVYFFYDVATVVTQWQGLLILGLFTTAIGHTLFLRSFKNFSVTTASILSGVEPVFGILIAVIFLKEIPSALTLVGGVLIISSVVIESMRSYKK